VLARGGLPLQGVDVVFHLAAAVSAECEADLDLGLRSNLDTTLALLQACRAAGGRPRFVFASSLAVFGQAPGLPLPAQVEDSTLPTPQSSYGVQKFVCEQLVADFGRRGLVRARSVRLMTVSVRPGRPNGAASGFLSGIIREPLAGLRAACPVAPDTPVAIASARNTVAGLLAAADADDAAWGPPVALNLPALSTTPGAMVDALRRLAGAQVAGLVDWTRDAGIERIVASWPSRIHAVRAAGLGLAPDEDVDALLRAYVEEAGLAERFPRAAA